MMANNQRTVFSCIYHRFSQSNFSFWTTLLSKLQKAFIAEWRTRYEAQQQYDAANNSSNNKLKGSPLSTSGRSAQSSQSSLNSPFGDRQISSKNSSNNQNQINNVNSNVNSKNSNSSPTTSTPSNTSSANTPSGFKLLREILQIKRALLLKNCLRANSMINSRIMRNGKVEKNVSTYRRGVFNFHSSGSGLRNREHDRTGQCGGSSSNSQIVHANSNNQSNQSQKHNNFGQSLSQIPPSNRTIHPYQTPPNSNHSTNQSSSSYRMPQTPNNKQQDNNNNNNKSHGTFTKPIGTPSNRSSKGVSPIYNMSKTGSSPHSIIMNNMHSNVSAMNAMVDCERNFSGASNHSGSNNPQQQHSNNPRIRKSMTEISPIMGQSACQKRFKISPSHLSNLTSSQKNSLSQSKSITPQSNFSDQSSGYLTMNMTNRNSTGSVSNSCNTVGNPVMSQSLEMLAISSSPSHNKNNNNNNQGDNSNNNIGINSNSNSNSSLGSIDDGNIPAGLEEIMRENKTEDFIITNNSAAQNDN